MLEKSAKERKEKYTSTWDSKVLKKLIANGNMQEKEAQEQSDSEKDRDVRVSAFKFIHGYQKGKKAKFFTFCLDEDEFVR